MLNENTARFFLGANTPEGFFPLYDELASPLTADTLYILKGGPGCGKSTFMRTVAAREKGGVEYIHCTGDPDSLDAVILKNRRIAYADGTAPHVLEPTLPSLRERYLDFSGFCSVPARECENIRRLTEEYKNAYASAYRIIAAAGSIRSDLLAAVTTDAFLRKAEKRAEGIIRREIPRKKGAGAVKRRFLSGLTCKGEITLWQTVTDNYDRVFHLRDSFGLSHFLLSPIFAAAEKAGCSVILCPCHWEPRRIRHLLLPELGTAFVTCAGRDVCPGDAYRRIRLDAMSETASDARLRPEKKLLRSLTEQSVAALARAKSLHDELEAAYRPYVDFAAVDKLTKKFAKE